MRRPIVTEFRLSDGATPPNPGALLWESVEDSVPQTDDLVYHGIGSGALTTYEVVAVRRIYRRLTVEGPSPGGGEQEVVGALSHCTPIVIVKVGT